MGVSGALSEPNFGGDLIAILREECGATRAALNRPIVLGVSGSQGSGKSTLARTLAGTLTREGWRVAVLSIDDLYLPKAERERLGAQVHPLLATRGPPGTHDVDLGCATIAALMSAGVDEEISIPRFEKARDDRAPREAWEVFRGRADLIIFEGWCVGAKAEPAQALASPVNELERVEDADGRWRAYVNAQLATRYGALFRLIDRLVMLKAPSFDVVFDWRRQQERELEAKLGQAARGSQIMDDAALARFISLYERLTRHILREMPARADVVATLSERREVLAVKARAAPQA
jgi:D-glycerate 3-kinase